MNIIAILILGISLSFDTFAVSITCGINENNIKYSKALKIASIFAITQAVMPLIGWIIGYSIKNYITTVDHWIAFGLLSIIGIKMIIESLKNNGKNCININDIRVIFTLAIATTIDALIVGITFPILKINIPTAIFVIGIVTFIVSIIGIVFGKNVGKNFGKKSEIIGGICLIILGLKILFEHLNIL